MRAAQTGHFALFRRAISENPVHVPTVRNYAKFLDSVIGDMTNAQVGYMKAVELQPSNAGALIGAHSQKFSLSYLCIVFGLGL